MLQRIALFIAALAASLVIVVGLAGAGILPGSQSTPVPTAVAAATDQPTEAPVQVDTVYVPAPVKPKTVIVHRNIPPAGGEHENESEGAGD